MPDFDDADIVTPPQTADFDQQDVVAKPVRAPVMQPVAQADFDVADVATAPQAIGDFEAGDVVSATQPPATPQTPRKLGVDLGVEPLPALPVDTTKPIGAAESIALREEAETGVRPTTLSTLAKTASAGLARVVERGIQEPALADLARGTKTTFFGPKKLEELDDDELSTTAAFAGISLPFVNDALDDWDKTTGKQFKSDAERKRARSLFVQGLAGEVLRERLQNKVDAGEQLNQRDQTLWAKLAAPAVRNTEEVMRFMAGAPTAVAIGAGERFGELTQPKRELQDGQVVETAEGDETAKALTKSIIGAGVEYAIERKGGELLNAGVGKVFRALPGGKALLGSISKMPVIGQAIDTFGKLARITGQQGLAGEVFEEGLQALADEGVGFAVRGAEKTTPISQRMAATARTFAQPENMKDLVLGMLLTQAVQGGAAATTAWQRQATQGRNLDGILTAFGADGQTLRGMTLEDKQNAYAAIQQQLTPEKAQAVLQRMGGRAADAYNQIAEAKGFGFATTADPQERLTKKVEYVQDTAKRLAGDVPVVAYATEADLIAANPEIAQAADYQPNTITGVYHNGQTHIVLDKMRTPQDIVSTVLHESGVHASLARMTPADKERILSGIGKDAMKRASAISQTLGIGDVPSAEEALALIGEQRVVNPSAYQRGVNALRNQIRAVYPSLKLNNSDLAVIIGDAQKAVRGEGGTFALMATVAPEAEQATTAAAPVTPAPVAPTPVEAPAQAELPLTPTQVEAVAPQTPASAKAVTPTPEVVTPAVEPKAQVQELAPQPPTVVEQAPAANVPPMAPAEAIATAPTAQQPANGTVAAYPDVDAKAKVSAEKAKYSSNVSISDSRNEENAKQPAKSSREPPKLADTASDVWKESQRFNEETPDIRFRRTATPAEDYQRDLRDAGLADRYVQVPKGETEEVRKAQLFRNLLYADGLDREGRDGLRRQAEAELSQGKTKMSYDAAAGAYNTDRSIDTARMVTVMNATMLDAVKPDASVETMDLADEVNLKAQEKFTRLGRALAFLRDRFNTPEGRRAELARILMMPDDVTAEKLKIAQTEAERRAIRRPVIQKARQRLKDLSKVQVIGADGKRTPLDINAFTSDQLMDDVLFKDAVSKIVQQRSSFGDKLYEFWQNSILSGPVTLFMVNPIGNVANIALELGPQRQAEIMLGKVFRSKDAPTEASTAAGFKYANAAMPDAWKNARMTFTTEQPQLGEYANKWDAGNQAIGRKLFGLDVGVDVGKVVRAPRNILSATDQGFRTWLMNFHIADLATRDFDNALKDPQSGVTESDREAFIQAALKDDSEFYAKAEQIADRELFQSKPGVLGQMFLSARRSENPIARELSRYLVPFVTTPANVIKTGARKTPLGTIPLVWNFARGKYTGTEAGKAEGVRLAAEQAVGWGVMMAVAALMEGDDDDPLGRPRITGTQQTSGRFRPGEREYEKRNEPPMSVRIGDNWYSYRRLEPIATILATVVDILNAVQQAKAGNFAKAGERMANSLVGMFSDRTYLKTVGDIIDAVRDNDPGSYMKIATGTVAGFVPNIAKTTMRGFDPIIRDIRNRSPKGTMEWLETSGKRLAQMAFPSPAVIEQPIARYDVYGRPLEKAGGPVENIVSPFTRQRADKMTRIDAMLKRYADRTGEMNVLPAPPQVPDIKLFGEKKPVTLTDEEFAEYQQLAGQAAAKRLATMTFRDYNNPTQYDVKRVQDVFKTARANAKVKMAGKVRQRVKRERGMTP